MTTATLTTAALTQRLLTVDEYHAMAEAGILGEDDRIELLEGRLFEMSPIGPAHIHTVIHITRLFAESTNALVSVQNPVRLHQHSEPEPDVVLLRPDMPTDRAPLPEDVLLLVEVADATLATDRQVKLPLYAEADIPEVWILALPEDTVEVYRQPEGGRYKQALYLTRGDEVAMTQLPKAGPFDVAALLPSGS